MNKPEILREYLWNPEVSPKNFESKHEYFSAVLDQYKICVEMASQTSGRRDIANAFFLTLNGLVIGSGAAIVEKGILFAPKWLLLLPYSVLLLQLFFWWRLVISYKQLNAAKFAIIDEIETQLPLRIFGQAEWRHLLEHGKNRKAYWPLTHLEQWIPWVFVAGYTIALFSLLFSQRSTGC